MADVSYEVSDDVIVQIELNTAEGFVPAGGRDAVVGTVLDAVGPAVEGARIVLERIREIGPTEVEVKFGIKVTGELNWLISRASSDANFEVTLKWDSHSSDAPS